MTHTLGSAPTVPPLPRSTIYLPSVSGGVVVEAADLPCGMNEDAWAFAQLWMGHKHQRRAGMRCVPELVDAAKHRCQTMMTENHFGHISLTGETANQVVRRYYGLPKHYNDGNQVESLGHGYAKAADLMRAIEKSPTAHKDHIFGLHPGWAEQVCIGVWCEWWDEEKYGGDHPMFNPTWCLLSAPALVLAY